VAGFRATWLHVWSAAGEPYEALLIRDSYAFIGNGGVFEIVNVSDPTTPVHVGEVNINSLIYDFIYAGIMPMLLR